VEEVAERIETNDPPVVDPLVRQVLHDYDVVRDPDEEKELQALKLAILVEDVFGIVLTDGEIDTRLLADPIALTALLNRRRDDD
jgi:hypothetical protein